MFISDPAMFETISQLHNCLFWLLVFSYLKIAWMRSKNSSKVNVYSGPTLLSGSRNPYLITTADGKMSKKKVAITQPR